MKEHEFAETIISEAMEAKGRMEDKAEAVNARLQVVCAGFLLMLWKFLI